MALAYTLLPAAACCCCWGANKCLRIRNCLVWRSMGLSNIKMEGALEKKAMEQSFFGKRHNWDLAYKNKIINPNLFNLFQWGLLNRLFKKTKLYFYPCHLRHVLIEDDFQSLLEKLNGGHSTTKIYTWFFRNFMSHKLNGHGSNYHTHTFIHTRVRWVKSGEKLGHPLCSDHQSDPKDLEFFTILLKRNGSIIGVVQFPPGLDPP